MIDAYEIGIQIMLQEDVSAGLAVINRGLADVDRAIVATSADLAGLVRNAETAAKAVSTAALGRTMSVPLSNQKSTASPDENGRQEPLREEPPTAVPSSAGSAQPAVNATGPQPVAPANQLNIRNENGKVRSEPDVQEQFGTSSAPVKSAIGETPSNYRSADVERTEPRELGSVGSGPQVVPKAYDLTEALAPRARELAGTVQQPLQNKALSISPVALTATVGREPRTTTAASQSLRAQYSSISNQPARRELTIAPWSGVDQSRIQSAAARFSNQAAAPQAAAHAKTEATGGVVMLDGRLVGQWLSEHMGREASRPPGGTSFFDPRQTPAWTVSGAL